MVNASSKEKAFTISSLALEKKAEDIKILDMQEIAAFCDYFVLMSGGSSTKTIAIADYITDSLDALGVKVSHREGRSEGQWIILDYSDVVVHVFQDGARRFYDLERLWGDAGLMNVKDKR